MMEASIEACRVTRKGVRALKVDLKGRSWQRERHQRPQTVEHAVTVEARSDWEACRDEIEALNEKKMRVLRLSRPLRKVTSNEVEARRTPHRHL
ncbi:unnamed protein product [Boreogadus saida]